MNPYRAVVSFWLDCIKSESALEQSFGVHASSFRLAARTRAFLFDGGKDPFIFADSNTEYPLQKGKMHDLVTRSKLKGQEIYFGYPLLMFFDRFGKMNRIAPLFVMRLDVDIRKDDAILQRGEASPTLGSLAFEKLGLKQEEVVALNGDLSEVFEANKGSKLETVLYLLKKETQLTFVEGIDPAKLSSAENIHPYNGTVVYNKAVLYASEASAYNLHLLNDLEKLAKRNDLHATALKYLDSPMTATDSKLTPVLPFLFDEYQLRAIRRILGSELTVVTGPPGTGKSQFIANLIVNLFLLKKKVLFVSHTGEAVRVVNERINTSFANLMMQTGKKEIRQDLGRRLEEMVAQYNDQQTALRPTSSLEDLIRNWQQIERETTYLQQSNMLSRKLESLLQSQQAWQLRTTRLRHIVSFILSLRLAGISRSLSRRRANYQILQSIEKLKAHHVEASREYVEAMYLGFILENGLYGQLLAYIDAVQSRKFAHSYASDKSEKYIHAALKAMNIWSCTLKSLAATFPLKANLFDYVIFDEASQIDLPSAAPALYRARNMVVVGDENQLNHIAKINPKLEEELANKHGLWPYHFYPALTRYSDVSLFNSAKRALAEPEQELKNHYRSNALIANLFSSIFYGGKLRVHEPDSTLPDDIKPGVYWIDVKGLAYKYKSGSRYNKQEVAYIVKFLERLLPVANERGLSIGITTPYSKQRDLLADTIVARFDADSLANVRVLTVHQFQGSEVDILLFSPVLAKQGDGGSDFWYIKNKQLLNVAVSRAKQLLLILGDLEYAQGSESKLRDIALYCVSLKDQEERSIPNRPMNIFEKRLLSLLKEFIPSSYKIEPQYVLDNRFTLDFALLSKHKKIAVELDGYQHEIIGGIPVFEDKQRDAHLAKQGWLTVRIPVHDLVRRPSSAAAEIKSQLKRKSKNKL